MSRRHHQLQAIMAIAIIMAAQALLVAHTFKHPVLDPHRCAICLYCDNTSHTMAAAVATMLALPAPVWIESVPVTHASRSHTAYSSIRAPPATPVTT